MNINAKINARAELAAEVKKATFKNEIEVVIWDQNNEPARVFMKPLLIVVEAFMRLAEKHDFGPQMVYKI